jgi:hypothetical protein
MLYFIHNSETGKLEHVSEEHPKHTTNYVCRNDIKTFVDAQLLAQDATALTGDLHIALDRGNHHYPRFDVIRAPKVGDAVSYGFNGDYYPCGTVTNISKTLKVIRTSTNDTFYRRGLTGTWLRSGTWALVQGTIDKRNPHF